jgi:para-aminobenzoate synthetase component 1
MRAFHDGGGTIAEKHGPRLVLAPASARGWFGGRAMVASGPVEVLAGASLEQAGRALEAQFLGEADSAVTMVVAAYAGDCTVVRFATSADGVLPEPAAPPFALTGPLLRDVAWDLSRGAFCAAVEETHERIRAGDVYVLNLTARLEGDSVAPSPQEAFAALAERASADMAAFVTGLPGAVPWIASVSPERFVRVRRQVIDGSRIVEIEPIKGTRPRGAVLSVDAVLSAGLLADVKERAEHVMVVDLERNDLGVVCVPGSIHVDPLYEIVSTPYCHQLVSRVRGVLRSDATFDELLAAVFPCGSVTGAPKRAAIRIAAELEATPRGAYCGSLLVAVPGELDSSVLIRTLEGIDGSPSRARYGTGCGVTIDSVPDAEYEEAALKASLVTGDGP